MYKLKISKGVNLITDNLDELDYLDHNLFDNYDKIRCTNIESIIWNGKLFNNSEAICNIDIYNSEPLTESMLQKFIELYTA